MAGIRAIAAAFCLSVSCGIASAGGAPDIDAGGALADRLCARCHAVGQTDASPFAAAPPFRTFARKWPLENLEEALAEGIVVGHDAMPAFALSPDQIADLIAHLETLQ